MSRTDQTSEIVMYSYLFNISSKWSSDTVLTILLKAEGRFKPFKSIFVKASGKQEEWKANKEALYDLEDDEAFCFFNWLEEQYGFPPYIHINRSSFLPYELYKAVKRSDEFDITVETNEPVEDFDDPGTYFDDIYKNIPPGVDF